MGGSLPSLPVVTYSPSSRTTISSTLCFSPTNSAVCSPKVTTYVASVILLARVITAVVPSSETTTLSADTVTFALLTVMSFVKPEPITVISLAPVADAVKSDVTTTSISFSTVGAGYLALWYADATNVNLPAFVKVTLYFVP